jgi:hypothetical protein
MERNTLRRVQEKAKYLSIEISKTKGYLEKYSKGIFSHFNYLII